MTRHSKVAVTLTLLALSATNSFASDRSFAMGARGNGPRRFPMERFASKLGLSDDQMRSFHDLEDRTMKAAIETHGAIVLAEHGLQRLIRADRPDRDAIFAKVDEIAALRARQRKHAIVARLEGRELLTPDQREKLEALIGEQGSIGRGKRGARPGGPPPGGEDMGPDEGEAIDF